MAPLKVLDRRSTPLVALLAAVLLAAAAVYRLGAGTVAGALFLGEPPSSNKPQQPSPGRPRPLGEPPHQCAAQWELLDRSPLPAGQHSLAVRQACVNQLGEVVLGGQEYAPDVTHPTWARGRVAALPQYTPEVQSYNLQWPGGVNGDFLTNAYEKMPAVPFRPLSSMDPPDIQTPDWDNSSVPLVFHPTWMYNTGHVLMSSVSWIHNNLNQSRNPLLSEHVRLAVRTPHGWEMPGFMRPMFQPLLKHPITTFAELGAVPEGQRQPGQALPSRCFCTLLFAESYRHEDAPNAWHAAQKLVEAYLPQLPEIKLNYTQSPALNDAGALDNTGADTHQPRKPPAVPPRRMLRVVFHTRDAAVRQFANLPQLLEECSRWTWRQQQEDGSMAVVQAVCATHTFKDTLSSIAVAQQADVFVAVHGANVANGFFMRPGSALVEVVHPRWPHYHHYWLNQDPNHQLLFFGLKVSAQHWSPGLFEQEQEASGLLAYDGNPVIFRDRNVHLGWRWLREVLDCVASLNNSVPLYRNMPQDQVLRDVGGDDPGPTNYLTKV